MVPTIQPTAFQISDVDGSRGEYLSFQLRNTGDSTAYEGVVLYSTTSPPFKENQDVLPYPTCYGVGRPFEDTTTSGSFPPIPPGDEITVVLDVSGRLDYDDTDPRLRTICLAATYTDVLGSRWVTDWSWHGILTPDAQFLQTDRVDDNEWEKYVRQSLLPARELVLG